MKKYKIVFPPLSYYLLLIVLSVPFLVLELLGFGISDFISNESVNKASILLVIVYPFIFVILFFLIISIFRALNKEFYFSIGKDGIEFTETMILGLPWKDYLVVKELNSLNSVSYVSLNTDISKNFGLEFSFNDRSYKIGRNSMSTQDYKSLVETLIEMSLLTTEIK